MTNGAPKFLTSKEELLKPGSPEPCLTNKPEAKPSKALLTFATGCFFKDSAFIVETAEISFVFDLVP
ncbi:MAG: Uncharacterised protein [Polaribacter sejongensis]|nr:MAG: Uncharacterised protein [Polaribacter sejongensis]